MRNHLKHSIEGCYHCIELNVIIGNMHIVKTKDTTRTDCEISCLLRDATVVPSSSL